MQKINSYLTKQSYRLVLWLLMTLIVGFLAPLKAFNLQWIIDSTSKQEAISNVFLCAVVVIGSFIFECLSRMLFTKIACDAEKDIRNKIVNNILKMDIATFEKKDSASYVSLLSNDLRTIYEDYFMGIFNVFFWGAILAVALGMYVFINPILLAAIIIMSFPPIFFPKLLNSRLRDAREAYSLQTASYIKVLTEQLRGFETIWSFMRQSCFGLFHEKESINTRKKEEDFQQKINVAMTVASFLSNLTFVFMLVIGMILVFENKITMGYMVTACSLANFVITPSQMISQYLMKIVSSKSIRQRIENELKIMPQNTGKEILINEIKEISCKNLSFSYGQNGEDILNSANFDADGTDKIAIIGESGSGKSTLAKILHQHYMHYSGNVKVNGIELSSIDRDSYFSKVGYISQYTFLFQDTIKNNICLYEDYSDSQVQEALRLSGLKDWVDTLPDGIEELLEEDGKNLSGGQRQRMAIARLIIRGYRVMIVDEITSGLDRDTAEKVMSNLLTLKCMVIAITHDTSSDFMKKFDKIYKVEHGCVKLMRLKEGSIDARNSIKRSL